MFQALLTSRCSIPPRQRIFCLATTGLLCAKDVSFRLQGCLKDLLVSRSCELQLAHATSQGSVKIDSIRIDQWLADCRVSLGKAETRSYAVTLTVRVRPRMPWQPWNDELSG